MNGAGTLDTTATWAADAARPRPGTAARTGGRILIDALRANGCQAVFGVPGESYLAALDALYESSNTIRYVTCRQEGGACFMAAAHADVTGGVGVCFVTRGPGATNASIGLHTAYQGSTPLILLVGQIPRALRDREAFQELDYRRMFAQVAKWTAEVDDPARLPEYVNRAYRIATSGRPGPVVLALPEDVLAVEAVTEDLPAAPRTRASPSPADMGTVRAALAMARRPLLLLGGSNWTRQGQRDIAAVSERHGIPVAVGFRNQGLFDHDHPHFIGNLGFGGDPSPNDYARGADLVLAIGTRLDDGTTLKGTLIRGPVPETRLIHVHPGAEELGRFQQPDLAIQADETAFAAALAALAAPGSLGRAAVCRETREAYEAMLDLPRQPGPIDMAEVMRVLNRALPPQTVMTTGAGNASDWPNIYYRYRAFRGALAPVSGAMGYGVPAAVAAKVADPGRPAVYMGGDGDFLMNGQELATAVQYGLDPVFIIVDNAGYGTIRTHQERRFPGRVAGTALRNPDFAAVARGYGAHGETVERTEAFAPALDRALAQGRAAVIHLLVGEGSLGPSMSLASLAAARTTEIGAP